VAVLAALRGVYSIGARPIEMKLPRRLRFVHFCLPLFVASAIFCGHSQAAHGQLAHDCGHGVTLRLSAQSPAQGGLLELTVASAAELEDLKGAWAGNPLPFWAVGERTRHALLGVDLERAPGKYDLALDAKGADGAAVTCDASVTVREGRFAIESLHVANQFVDVSPEDRERADKESARLHEIYSQTTPERLWHGAFRMPLAGVKSGRNFDEARLEWRAALAAYRARHAGGSGHESVRAASWARGAGGESIFRGQYGGARPWAGRLHSLRAPAIDLGARGR
jgi:hypothetical protein